jgi:circadian clock protein KaiB
MNKGGQRVDQKAKVTPEPDDVDDGCYSLWLFVTGVSPRSSRAIVNVRKVCEEYLAGRYELNVIDILQKPEVAKAEQIFAAPTLVKKLPLPLRRLIGDMSETDRLLVGLDIQKT